MNKVLPVLVATAFLSGSIGPASQETSPGIAEYFRLRTGNDQEYLSYDSLPPAPALLDIAETLPTIDDPQWLYGSYGLESNVFTYDAGQKEQLILSKRLPEGYQKFIIAMLNQTVVQEAVKEDLVGSIVGIAATQDNGHPYTVDHAQNISMIEVDISDGHSPWRLYKYGVNLLETGIHETGHAITEPWFKYIEAGTTPSDPILAAKLKRLSAICSTVQDQSFLDWVSIDTMSSALETSSENIANNQQPSTLSETFPEQSAKYAQAFKLSSKYVENSTPTDLLRDIENADVNNYCGLIDVFDVINVTPNQEDKPGMQDLDINPVLAFDSTPLYQLEIDERAEAKQTYSCVDESAALEALLNNGSNLIAGHSFDNPSEFAASLVVILSLNPNYLANCLQTLPFDQKGIMTEYVSATLDLIQYSTPGIYQTLLKSNPDTAQVVSDILASGGKGQS